MQRKARRKVPDATAQQPTTLQAAVQNDPSFIDYTSNDNLKFNPGSFNPEQAEKRKSWLGSYFWCLTWTCSFCILLAAGGVLFYLFLYLDIELDYYRVRLDYGNSKDLNITSQVNRLEFYTLKYAENYNTDTWIPDL